MAAWCRPCVSSFRHCHHTCRDETCTTYRDLRWMCVCISAGGMARRVPSISAPYMHAMNVRTYIHVRLSVRGSSQRILLKWWRCYTSVHCTPHTVCMYVCNVYYAETPLSVHVAHLHSLGQGGPQRVLRPTTTDHGHVWWQRVSLTVKLR